MVKLENYAFISCTTMEKDIFNLQLIGDLTNMKKSLKDILAQKLHSSHYVHLK